MTTNRLEPCIKLPLENEILEDIVDKAKDWALMHGAGMRSKVNFSKDSLQFAPFILLPSTFPREEFNKATEIQIILNELIHKVAHDYGFLSSSLKSTVEVDEFTSRLFKIYETVHNEGTAQMLSLGLFRSDYLAHSAANNNIKQVEINTIASSFGGICTHIPSLHRYVLQELGHGDKIKNVPVNTALEGLCGGMLEAWKIYGDPNAVILFVIENITYNICDQRFHEFEIRRQNRMVVVIRRTLTQIADTAKLGKNKELSIDGLSVAVVYFRSGYEPAQYPSSKEWAARLMIERSLAIKCPSIHYHLAGTKKVQQTLATPGVLEKFLTDPAKVDAVKEIFTGLYSLDLDEDGNRAAEMAIMKPECYVLKPQREGGGNNVYGEKVREVLQSMTDSQERTAWILMERIIPPVQKGYMIRPGGPEVPQLVDLVSELGIFGVIIGNASTVIANRQVGHMLRTKLSSADEGGVAAGSGALDSPYLID
ncbi:Glutathione synthetase [Cryptotermes secundus]|uniref:Glutathione synthetase n=1 Tax=Cryptotermes secundus TaxID=105785 RepID=A0A2J7QQS3_9NEOP|nr:glutathione synthetase isoform X3 [Cryptotermes secundus]PNF30933.1 Glutathione synthetase [Cryptotermes secundus]PNF30934.1 Glutathione synthetase [Cryptotermes secundus]